MKAKGDQPKETPLQRARRERLEWCDASDNPRLMRMVLALSHSRLPISVESLAERAGVDELEAKKALQSALGCGWMAIAMGVLAVGGDGRRSLYQGEL